GHVERRVWPNGARGRAGRRDGRGKGRKRRSHAEWKCHPGALCGVPQGWKTRRSSPMVGGPCLWKDLNDAEVLALACRCADGRICHEPCLWHANLVSERCRLGH